MKKEDKKNVFIFSIIGTITKLLLLAWVCYIFIIFLLPSPYINCKTVVLGKEVSDYTSNEIVESYKSNDYDRMKQLFSPYAMTKFDEGEFEESCDNLFSINFLDYEIKGNSPSNGNSPYLGRRYRFTYRFYSDTGQEMYRMTIDSQIDNFIFSNRTGVTMIWFYSLEDFNAHNQHFPDFISYETRNKVYGIYIGYPA